MASPSPVLLQLTKDFVVEAGVDVADLVHTAASSMLRPRCPSPVGDPPSITSERRSSSAAPVTDGTHPVVPVEQPDLDVGRAGLDFVATADRRAPTTTTHRSSQRVSSRRRDDAWKRSSSKIAAGENVSTRARSFSRRIETRRPDELL